jgi:hypothetical protein
MHEIWKVPGVLRDAEPPGEIFADAIVAAALID